jgi:hypothetical protein
MPDIALHDSYDVAASLRGFKTTTMKKVEFGTCEGDCKSAHYVQLQLEPSGPTITVD